MVRAPCCLRQYVLMHRDTQRDDTHGGLPVWLARRLFQQVVLIIDFTRRHGLNRELDPTNLFIFNHMQSGRPVLKLGYTRMHKWGDTQVRRHCATASCALMPKRHPEFLSSFAISPPRQRS